MTFQCRDAYGDLKCRSWWIRRRIRTWQKRDVRVRLQRFELIGRDGGNEYVGVVSGPGRQRQNITAIWIDNYHRAALCFRCERLFRQFLQVQIKCGDYVVSGLRRRNELLGCFTAVLIECEFVFTVLAGEHLVKSLLESLASFSFRPDCFVVIDNAVGISAGFSSVTNDLSRNFSIRINPDVNGTNHHARRQVILDSVILLRCEV